VAVTGQTGPGQAVPGEAGQADQAGPNGAGAGYPGGMRSFRAGMRDAIPFILSCFPFSFACGLLGRQAGLSLVEIGAMAALVYAGTAQFIGITLIAAGASPLMIILSSLIVNLRYLLQGLSLSPFLSWLPVRWLLAIAFGIVDESYAVAISRYLKAGQPRGDPVYFFGCTASLYVVWVSVSVAGGALGAVVGDPCRWGLDFAMPAAFISIVMPQLTDSRALTVLMISGLAALIAKEFTPGTTYLILAAVFGSVVGIALEAFRPAARPAAKAPAGDGSGGCAA